MPFPEEAQRKGGEATRDHGVYAVASRGKEALRGPAEKGRYQELKELVRTYPGRVELKEELATLAMMIVELGASSLRETHNKGGSVFDDKAILKALSPYMNVALKALDSLPDDKERADHAQLVGEMTERVNKAKAEVQELEGGGIGGSE